MLNRDIYQSFIQASGQYHGLVAIDYFLAKEVCQDLNQNLNQDINERQAQNNDSNLTSEQSQQLFHLIILLSQSLRAGHSCLLLEEIAGQRFGYACDEQGYVSHNGYVFSSLPLLHALLENLNINAEDTSLIVYQQGRVYLRRYFQFETELSQALIEKLANKDISDQDNSVEDGLVKDKKNKEVIEEKITQCLSMLFTETSPDEIDWQQVAVANALNKGFSVIAGGPGTGKTYTVTKLLAGLVQLNLGEKPLNIMLCAPTGKAAQRLSESISQAVVGFKEQISADILALIPTQATTLHRLLGVIPNSPNFRHHQGNKLAVDVLLIDEVSMVDLPMMTRVLRALPSTTKVILLGDADQLPSVATGSVLTDIAPRPHQGYSKENIRYLARVIGNEVAGNALLATAKVKAKKIPADHVTFLTKSRRFDGEGLIGRLAGGVIAGQAKASWQLLANPDEKTLTNNDNFPVLLKGELSTWLTPLVKKYYQPLFNLSEVGDAFKQLSLFSILCATRQGESGVDFINEQTKSILSSLGCLRQSDDIFHGQPIMIRENDYGVGLYNGDIGLIWRHESGHLMAVFEDDKQGFRWIMPSRLPPFETVFAMTIHKTQGSEFKHVAMILPNQQDNKLLSRELVYTGITRAKSYLSIACLAHVWQSAIEAKVKRHSGLQISEPPST